MQPKHPDAAFLDHSPAAGALVPPTPEVRGPMNGGRCGGDAVLAVLQTSVAHLEAYVGEVDRLNVFPVPDGDTGSNMLATMRAALEKASAVPAAERGPGWLASAAASGALLAARGNSGVILSQLLRGLAEALPIDRPISGRDVAYALRRGVGAGYAAVARPVEGTILTVAREAAEAAEAAADGDPGAVLAAAAAAARGSVARTPSLLPVLREAGVVDAGGQGLFRLLEGALLALRGAVTTAPRETGALRPGGVRSEGDASERGFGYEIVFLVAPFDGAVDLERVRGELGSMGESVLVAGDAQRLKVHVHSLRPDVALGYGLSLGALSDVRIENLDVQADAAREDLVGVGGRPGDATRAATSGGTAGGRAAGAVVAVAAGEGLGRVFESFGVGRVVVGGRGRNPSAGELLAAARALGAPQVLLLPNDRDVELAARQAAELCHEKRVVVVPTRSAPEGFAALLAIDDARDAEGNAEAMLAAAGSVQTLRVATAVRDAHVGERKVEAGQTIVLTPDEGIVAAAADARTAILDGLAALRPGFELLTFYPGADVSEEAAGALAAAVGAEHPGVEIEVVPGGQAHDSYLIAAE